MKNLMYFAVGASLAFGLDLFIFKSNQFQVEQIEKYNPKVYRAKLSGKYLAINDFAPVEIDLNKIKEAATLISEKGTGLFEPYHCKVDGCFFSRYETDKLGKIPVEPYFVEYADTYKPLEL